MGLNIEAAPPLEVILLCIAAAMAIIVVIVLVVRHKRLKRLKTGTYYMEALKDLIRGNEENAFRNLKKTVAEDTGNIDAYLKLGDIFRGRGELEKALQIHRQLTVRTDLSSQNRMELLKSLVLDYLENRKEERAITTLKELLSMDRKNLWGHRKLLGQYERQGDWNQALSTQEEILKIAGSKDDSLLALYEVQIANQLMAKDDFHRARLKYKDALRRDRYCVAAYLGLGDAYQKENRLDDAIENWKALLITIPKKAYFVFGCLEKALYEKGQFGEVAKLYRDLLERDPANIRALLALANIYDKKGDIDEAIKSCEKVLEIDPGSAAARQFLVKLYQQRGDQAKVIENLEILVSVTVSTKNRFECNVCGNVSSEPLWYCPQCGQWRTYDL